MLNESRAQSHTVALHQFLNMTLDQHLQRTAVVDLGESPLHLFGQVAKSVPAYAAFLADQGIEPDSIQTPADFAHVPPTTKQNYILKYPLPQLCYGGRVEGCDMVAVSSGSTGKPTFWLRSQVDELTISWRFEQVFHDSFRADERTTLAVVCFALGTWVGGMYTAACCRHLAAKGYPITVVTPGSNRDEILRAVQELGPHFDQVVLLGYPPFLKGVIDAGRARGIEWKRYAIRWVLAGEVFSEEWRDLIGDRVGSTDPLHDSAALYGTADAGVLGCETPLSICIRRWLSTRPEIARPLFGESRLPTLVQYDPRSRYFEVELGHLLFSGDNGIPLIRYNILDTGGIVSYPKMLAYLTLNGFDPIAELGERGVRPLPFVWVFGRSDFTVSYYGANIYPENVTVGLEQPGIHEWVTGKFVMQAAEDAHHDSRLRVTVELAPGIEANAAHEELASESILTALRHLNSEFAHYVPSDRQRVEITFKPAGDPVDFPVGVKHRYTRPS